MDKLIYTAFNTLNNIYDNRSVRAQNMANISVPGYRRDLGTKASGTAFMVGEDTLNTRALAIRDDKNYFEADPGTLSQTDVPTDIAIRGSGYFVVQGLGEPSLSRRGDLKVDENGALRNGANSQILNTNLQPFNVPPHREIKINETGDVLIVPLGSALGTEQNIGTIAMTLAEGADLKKFPDGEIRVSDGTIPAPDKGVRVIPKFIELSNVNITEELVNTIEDQRAYEINVKLISSTSELDQAGASLLRMPN